MMVVKCKFQNAWHTDFSELNNNKKFMVAFVENIPELVALKYIDECYLFVNKCFKDWVGVGRDVVIVKAFSVFLSL